MKSELVILTALVACGSAIKIVVFLQGTFESDRQHFLYLSQHLANRNHKVAIVKALIVPEEKRLVKHRLHDVRELNLNANADKETLGNLTEIWKTAPWQYEYDTVETKRVYWPAYVQACQAMVDSDLGERLREAHYDVALVYAGQPCQLAVAYMLAIPVVYFDADGFTDDTAIAAGMGWQAGWIPSSDSRFGQDMGMAERLVNAMLWTGEYVANSDIHPLARLVSSRYTQLDHPINSIFQNDYELKKHFDDFPTMAELKRNVDVFLINGDKMLDFYGRELPPNVAYVGGYHIEPVKPLFEPWNETIASTPDGLILFSLGRRISFSSMPIEYMHSLFAAFGKFQKSRVFVMTDDLNLPPEVEIPSNVNLTRHVPMAELMSTGSVRLLITNGGQHALMEAAIFAVPCLVIPMVSPDYQNARKFAQKNLAVILDKQNITAENVERHMKIVIDNPKYQMAAREFKRVYDERPLDGLNTLLYYLEYVGSNHGAGALKSPNWLRSFSLLRRTGLDLFLLLFVWPSVLIRLTAWLLRFITGAPGLERKSDDVQVVKDADRDLSKKLPAADKDSGGVAAKKVKQK